MKNHIETNEMQSIDLPDDEVYDDYSDDDLFKISSWGADLSFRELINRYDDNELIKPELQRNYVWDKSEASRFIDSILLGLPVPSVFLAKTKDEKLLIIDGYQRIMSVRDYVKGKFSKDNSVFKLSRTEKIHEKWRNKAFLELEEELQRKIRNTTIHAIVFTQQHPTNEDTSLFQIFERINSNGRTLLPQEIRNCVYQGPINSLLFDLNNNEKWRKLWGNSRPEERMRDMEYILRFFALSELISNPITTNKISLKKYLNKYMGTHNNESEIKGLRNRFNSAIEFVHENFGINAFQNISSLNDRIHNIQYTQQFSPTIFDSLLISVDKFLSKGSNLPTENKFELEKKRISCLKHQEYINAISKETMKISNIQNRVQIMYRFLFEQDF